MISLTFEEFIAELKESEPAKESIHGWSESVLTKAVGAPVFVHSNGTAAHIILGCTKVPLSLPSYIAAFCEQEACMWERHGMPDAQAAFNIAQTVGQLFTD